MAAMHSLNREATLRRRIRLLVWFFIVGLVISGLTAIPLQWELNLGAQLLGGDEAAVTSGLVRWVVLVRDGLNDTYAKYPFIAYGTDWLAFGHLMIAVVFVGALRDPKRNVWLFDFGIIACVLVVPFALIFGGVRGIPFYWRLIDCSFGVFGIIPLWLCRKWVRELGESESGNR